MRISHLLVSIILFCATISDASDKKAVIRVFCAAGISNAIEEACKNFQKDKNIIFKTNYASSPILARQIIYGAEADIFISAHPIWIEELKKNKIIQDDSVYELASTRIALFTIKNNNKKRLSYYSENLEFKKGELPPFDQNTKIAIADEYVPSGIFARQSLNWLGWNNNLKTVSFPDARAVIAAVESQSVDFGIAYLAEVAYFDKLEIIGIFPEESHEKVIFSLARISSHSRQLLEQFIQYLLSDADGIFKKNGFEIMSDNSKR